MTEALTTVEQQCLLRLAREAIEHAVRGKLPPPLNYATLPQRLNEHGASFVTLTMHGQLRGCIGALEAYQPLAEDVREHAIAAAQQDPRFPPVDESELNQIHIEVSHLTAPVPLEYATAEDLITRLQPQVDGVILRDGYRRATFLPQVWQQLPNPEDFLGQLCLKLGVPRTAWRAAKLQVHIYRVEEFHEMN